MILDTKHLILTYEKGNIRWIRIGNHEIIRMIYPAIRDKNWETIQAQLKDEKIVINKDSFTIKYKAIYKLNEIHFEADYVIKGVDNSISFEMNGIAKNDFLKNRIGLCILQPIEECAGQPFEVVSPNGDRKKHYFPDQIAPHQPAKNIRELIWKINEIKAKLFFEGDIFEIEDQRNWTDASYKTYSTPLDLPFPVKIKKNETVYQKVTLEIENAEVIQKEQNNNIEILIENKKQVFPNIGFLQSTHQKPLSENEINLLKQIEIGHIRGDIHFSDNEWELKCFNLFNVVIGINSKLFLALHFTNNWKKEIDEFINYISSNNISIDYILLFDEESRITTDKLIAKVFSVLKNNFPKSNIGGGVDGYFAELNRTQLKANKPDFISYSISPQVHATDDMSLVENLEGQKFTIKSAKKLFPDKNIFVSPVTLKQRFNVVATTQNGDNSFSIDHRQSLLFNALWTLISIKYLSESGIDLITYFEIFGSKGIMDKETFPVYHIFEMIKEARNIIKTKSTSPLTVDSICLEFDNKTILYLVNFSEDIQKVRLPKEFQTSTKIQIIGNNNDVSEPHKGALMTIQSKSILGFQIDK